MTEYRYLDAPAGAGKSYYAAQQIINTKASHLIVRDRLEAIEEYRAELHEMCPSLLTDSITSATVSNVRASVRDVPGRFIGHCAVFITHEALMSCDMSAFEGWHIWIDETPAIFTQETFTSNISHDFLRRNYQLAQVDEGGDWHSLALTEAGWRQGLKEIGSDDALKVYRTLHERVMASSDLPKGLPARLTKDVHHDPRRVVICDMSSWDDAGDQRPWTWWSAWSPRSLSAFASVTFMANSFDQSLAFAFFRKFDQADDWKRIEIEHRPYRERDVTIEYFVHAHQASRNLFTQYEGKAYLRQIVGHLGARQQIWMTNERYAPSLHGMAGKQLRPKQAGSNSYSDYHNAACIYAAKPSPEQQNILESIGLDPTIWTETNEHEVILQFGTRTSIRDPDSAEPVTLTVYDAKQAGYLKRYFESLTHCKVTTQLTDLGFASVERSPGPRTRRRSAEEIEAAERKRRDATRRRAKSKRDNMSPAQRRDKNRKRRERYARRKDAA